MTDEILKLAEEFGFKPMGPIHDEMLEAFYHAAFNAAISSVIQSYSPDDSANDFLDKIKQLELDQSC
jgi:hypothetical protein